MSLYPPELNHALGTIDEALEHLEAICDVVDVALDVHHSEHPVELHLHGSPFGLEHGPDLDVEGEVFYHLLLEVESRHPDVDCLHLLCTKDPIAAISSLASLLLAAHAKGNPELLSPYRSEEDRVVHRVEARFLCTDVEDGEHDHGTVRFTADLPNDDGEWKDFTDITPSGELEMAIMKDAPALELFEAGEVYKVTFERATQG